MNASHNAKTRRAPLNLATAFRKTNGFTLVELLVVIAIIGVLVALLLPAVQAAREAARRSSCVNNVKQVGLALHLHLDAHRHFPPGQVRADGPPMIKGIPREGTWVYPLLPFFEEQNVQLRSDQADFGMTNQKEVRSRRLPLMICPSNPEVGNWNPTNLEWGNYARGNYGANNGIGPMAEYDSDDLIVNPRMAGVFYLDSRTKIKELSDGLSKTSLISEMITVPGDIDFRGVFHYPEGPLLQYNRTPNSYIPDDYRAGTYESTLEAPCATAYGFWYDRKMILSARSFHAGGVNVLMADSSVHFATDEIDLEIWKATSSPAGASGEPMFTGF